MTSTQTYVLASLTALGIAIAVAVYPSGGAGTPAADALGSAQLRSDLESLPCAAGSDVTTGVTLPPGYVVTTIVPTKDAAGNFDVSVVMHMPTEDGQVWLSVTAHNHGDHTARFTADIGYGLAPTGSAP